MKGYLISLISGVIKKKETKKRWCEKANTYGILKEEKLLPDVYKKSKILTISFKKLKIEIVTDKFIEKNQP